MNHTLRLLFETYLNVKGKSRKRDALASSSVPVDAIQVVAAVGEVADIRDIVEASPS